MRTIPVRKVKVKKKNPTRTRVKECTPGILEAIRGGMSIEKACGLVRVSSDSYYKWRLRNEELNQIMKFMSDSERDGYRDSLLDHDRAVLDLFVRLVHAKSECIDNSVKRVQQAAKGGRKITETKRTFINGELKVEIITARESDPVWQADAWILERRFPEDYSRNRIPVDETAKRVADEIEAEINS